MTAESDASVQRGEFLIDQAGAPIEAVQECDVAFAIGVLGYIHIRYIDHTLRDDTGHARTVIVTLEPKLSSDLMVAAAGYEIADLAPARTVVVASLSEPKVWIFPGYMPAIRQIAALVEGRQEPREAILIDTPLRPI